MEASSDTTHSLIDGFTLLAMAPNLVTGAYLGIADTKTSTNVSQPQSLITVATARHASKQYHNGNHFIPRTTTLVLSFSDAS